MSSPRSADRSAAQPSGSGAVDALITQARRLRGDVDAVRQGARGAGRWERALYELALHQLSDLDDHLAQLRDGPAPRRGALLSRVGSAEWNLLTDDVVWSVEFHRILGRDPAGPALTLDELPSVVLEEDRPKLTVMVTDCLVDSRPIDGEFRVVRPDGDVRAVHMMGEPVLGPDGCTASMWAVLRDVSELRRSQLAVTETRDSARPVPRQQAGTRLAVESQEAVLPPWHGSLRLPHQPRAALEVAARCLPAPAGSLIGADWYDTLQLPCGDLMLTVGSLSGQGPAATSTMAMLLGALRGMALAGTEPGRLMGLLDQLLEATAHPSLGSALCCRYRPATRTLTWSQAGACAPLLYRAGSGSPLGHPNSPLLGSSSGPAYQEWEAVLEPGDVLVLHTDGLLPAAGGPVPQPLGGAEVPVTAQEFVDFLSDAHGKDVTREDAACLLAARVTP